MPSKRSGASAVPGWDAVLGREAAPTTTAVMPSHPMIQPPALPSPPPLSSPVLPPPTHGCACVCLQPIRSSPVRLGNPGWGGGSHPMLQPPAPPSPPLFVMPTHPLPLPLRPMVQPLPSPHLTSVTHPPSARPRRSSAWLPSCRGVAVGGTIWRAMSRACTAWEARSTACSARGRGWEVRRRRLDVGWPGRARRRPEPWSAAAVAAGRRGRQAWRGWWRWTLGRGGARCSGAGH